MSILATTYDNPYLTEDQLAAMGRRIKDPDKRRQLMLSERPMSKGNEFTPELLRPCQCEALDDVMTNARADELPGTTSRKCRVRARCCGSRRPPSLTATS